MTSTEVHALIEEARRRLGLDWAILSEDLSLFRRLADALEASEAQRRELADKIWALEMFARTCDKEAAENYLDELRGLVSGDNKEKNGRDIYFDNLRKTAGPRVLAIIDEMQREGERP